MDKRNDILNELQEISGVVASLPAVVPYTLPEGYFDAFSTEVLSRISGREPEHTAGIWLGQPGEHPFEAPDGYFNDFASGMMQRIKAMDSEVPSEETHALSPLLGRMDKKLPFTMPDDYFTELPEEIVTGIHAIDFVNRELEILSPVMAAAGKSNVYEVPKEYFNELAPAVLQKAKAEQPAPVIRPNFGRRLVQYASAALVAGAIATGAWLFFQDQPAPASIADAVTMKKISNDEIISYLENNPVSFSESSTASVDIKQDDLKELLADVPVKELEEYLDQYAISKNTVIN